MYTTIVVGTDGSDTAAVAWRHAIGLATLSGATLHIVNAYQPVNTVGNTGRNTLVGPPQRQINLSVFKNLTLHGATKLQIRAEGFNITNTANFANPNASFGTAGFGTITSTGNSIPRQIQFAAKLLF